MSAPDLPAADLEAALFSMMKAFEALAVAVYEREAPDLCTPEKRTFVAHLATKSPNDDALNRTVLAEPVRVLLDKVAHQPHGALLVQGLVLEQLGRVIYERIQVTPLASAAGKALAKQGQTATLSVLDKIPNLVTIRIGTGDTLFAAFVQASGPVFSQLDSLGEGVDAVFGKNFDIQFAEVMGDLTAELLPMCVELGMERRKLVIHLTGALMKTG
jgi:hypothetical protein